MEVRLKEKVNCTSCGKRLGQWFIAIGFFSNGKKYFKDTPLNKAQKQALGHADIHLACHECKDIIINNNKPEHVVKLFRVKF
jgi:ribosomal protein S27E